MYLHKATTSKTRVNDISHIQIEEYNNNKESIINQNITLLVNYNINEKKETIILMTKSKWKKLVKLKIEEKQMKPIKMNVKNLRN